MCDAVVTSRVGGGRAGRLIRCYAKGVLQSGSWNAQTNPAWAQLACDRSLAGWMRNLVSKQGEVVGEVRSR